MTPWLGDLKYSVISISIFFVRLIQHMDNTFGHFVDTSPGATLSTMRDIFDANIRLLFFIYNCFTNIYSFKPILYTYTPHFVKGISILIIRLWFHEQFHAVSPVNAMDPKRSWPILSLAKENQYSAGGNP